jgi:hypothetical protein
MMVGLMVMVMKKDWVVAKDRRRVSHAPLGGYKSRARKQKHTYLD